MKISFLCCCLLWGVLLPAQTVFTKDTVLMASPFRITVVANNKDSAYYTINKAIEEIDRIEQLISEWQPQTPVSRLNSLSGVHSVKLPTELIQLINIALSFSEKTQGAFDISVASMDKIWQFDGSMNQLPTKEMIKKSIEKVGYKNIVVNPQEESVLLAKKGMKIGFGSIGKAYAADRGVAILKSLGVSAGIVDAAGDLATFGTPPVGDTWRIGIRNPYDEDWADILHFKNASVATSGDYEKYALIDGVCYGHIINPHTGYPTQGLVSVSVLGKEATIANGLSTSIMVLGIEKGLQLMQQYPDYACLLITDTGKVIRSKNYKKIKRKLAKR